MLWVWSSIEFCANQLQNPQHYLNLLAKVFKAIENIELWFCRTTLQKFIKRFSYKSILTFEGIDNKIAPFGGKDANFNSEIKQEDNEKIPNKYFWSGGTGVVFALVNSCFIFCAFPQNHIFLVPKGIWNKLSKFIDLRILLFIYYIPYSCHH